MKDFTIALLLCSLRLSLLVLLCAVLFRAARRRIAARIQYTVWRMVALSALIPFSVPSPLFNLAPAAAPAPTVPTDKTVTGAATTPPPSVNIWQVLFFVWLTGAALLLGYHLAKNAAAIALIHRWRDSRTAAPAAERQLAQVRRDMRLSRPVRFYRSKAADGPMAFGILSPTVVLPCRAYADAQLRLIFQHELIHVSRRDALWKAAALMAAALHWFNPCVYWLLRQSGASCELSCDEVMTAGRTRAERLTYGQLIADGATRAGHYFGLYTAMSVKNSLLKQRLTQIIDGETKRNPLANTVTLAGAVMVTLALPCLAGYAQAPAAPSSLPTVSNEAEAQPAFSATLPAAGETETTTTTTTHTVSTTRQTVTNTTTRAVNSTNVGTSRTPPTTTVTVVDSTTVAVTSRTAYSLTVTAVNSTTAAVTSPAYTTVTAVTTDTAPAITTDTTTAPVSAN